MEQSLKQALDTIESIGSIWRPPSVTHQPQAVLSRWRIFRCEFEDGTTSDHAVGYCGSGRVTSAIAERRLRSGEVVTKSGRLYKLAGAPGANMDALYVWGRWSEANRVQKETDVSEEYYAEMLESETPLD